MIALLEARAAAPVGVGLLLMVLLQLAGFEWAERRDKRGNR